MARSHLVGDGRGHAEDPAANDGADDDGSGRDQAKPARQSVGGVGLVLSGLVSLSGGVKRNGAEDTTADRTDRFARISDDLRRFHLTVKRNSPNTEQPIVDIAAKQASAITVT